MPGVRVMSKVEMPQMDMAKSAREGKYAQHKADPETDEIEGLPVHLDFFLREDCDGGYRAVSTE